MEIMLSLTIACIVASIFGATAIAEAVKEEEETSKEH